MSYIDTLDEAWRALLEVSAEVGPTEAPKMDFPLTVMLGIHHEACARVKGRLPWNCDLGDLEKFGPGAIEYLEGLSRKHSQVNLFAQTIRLMRAFEGYLRTAKPSGAIRPEVERRLVARHDELITGFEKELARKASDYLVGQFGPGWGFQTVRHCVRAAYTFSLLILNSASSSRSMRGRCVCISTTLIGTNASRGKRRQWD